MPSGYGNRRTHRVRRGLSATATIVMPPRAFCLSVTVTSAGGSSSAAATSSRIRTASASQNAPSSRKRER